MISQFMGDIRSELLDQILLYLQLNSNNQKEHLSLHTVKWKLYFA